MNFKSCDDYLDFCDEYGRYFILEFLCCVPYLYLNDYENKHFIEHTNEMQQIWGTLSSSKLYSIISHQWHQISQESLKDNFFIRGTEYKVKLKFNKKIYKYFEYLYNTLLYTPQDNVFNILKEFKI